MFHPSQQKYCDELATNLSASSFFFANNEIAGRLVDAIRFANDSAKSSKAAAWSAADRAQLDKALSVVREALDDPDWNQLVMGQAVLVATDGIDPELMDEFGGLKQRDTSEGVADLMPLGGLVTLRGTLHQLRRETAEGWPKWRDDEELGEELITRQQQMRREGWKPPRMATKKKGEVEQLKELGDGSAFRNIKLGRTSSAKLNWVIDEVTRHKSDKFIIFSSVLTDLAFATLSEAFDVLNIQHVIYAGSGHTRTNASGIRDRGHLISFFNHSPASVCQCILVDAKLGGRGVGLTSASRVVFLEPMWQPDLLVQAEKRAHRLGQAREVVQHTLCVRGSWEERMWRRRAGMTRREVEGRKAPQRDERLGEVLRGAEWLEPTGGGEGRDGGGEEGWRPFEIEVRATGAGRRGSGGGAGGTPPRAGSRTGASANKGKGRNHGQAGSRTGAQPVQPALRKRALGDGGGGEASGAGALPTPVGTPRGEDAAPVAEGSGGVGEPAAKKVKRRIAFADPE